jgi:Mn-dependent DtxR family transcriptional regulator
LRELKRLHRKGWIELIWYALVEEDERGVRISETSEKAEMIGLAAAASRRISDTTDFAGRS